MLRIKLFALALAGISAAAPAVAEPMLIVALGDSNMTGFYWVPRKRAFPEVLERRLRESGLDVHVKNAGVNGDTTAGMLKRLDEAVPPETRLVIVQGGHNDLRKGGTPASITANVSTILGRLRARRIGVVLCGFYDYPWAALARRYEATLVPSTFCYDHDYRGFDRVHMDAKGHKVVAARLFPVVQKLLGPPLQDRGARASANQSEPPRAR